MAAGSFADHEALSRALDEYERHTALAVALDLSAAAVLADGWFLRLAQAAMACGFPASDPSARVLPWSRARVATFRRTYPRAA